MKYLIIGSLAAFAIAMLLDHFSAPLFYLFPLLILTLVLGARLMGDATEQVANYYSQTVGGLLNATLGNLAELIIAFFALKAGLIDVVRASLVGSMMSNALFAFGTAVFVGGMKKKIFKLNPHETAVSGTMLLLSAFLFLLPSLLFLFHEQTHVETISLAASGVLLLLYVLSAVFSFYTHKEYFITASHEKPTLKKSHALWLLVLAIAIVILASESFASHLESVAHALGFGELFVGAIIVGIVGNIAENLSVIQFARKGKMGLVVGTTVGSVIQIGMFVTPLLVFISLFFSSQLTLDFLPIEVVSVLLTVLLVNQIAKDDSVNWFEGVQLLALYVVLAVLFFFAR